MPRLIANEPLQTPLTNKFCKMEIDQQQVSNRQNQFQRALSLVEEHKQEEAREARQQFTAHNPSNDDLFDMSQMILEKSAHQFEAENPLFQPTKDVEVQSFKGNRRSARRLAMKGKGKSATKDGSNKKSKRKGAMEEEQTAV